MQHTTPPATPHLSVSDALHKRISVRAYTDQAVPRQEIETVLDRARLAPSGGNLQPWRVDVVIGGARDRLVTAVQKAIGDNPFADEAEISIYPPGLEEPYRTRRYALGEAMYEKLGIPRDDKPARLQWLLRNFEFFGAPAGLFFSLDRRFDKGQWAHLGMFMQSVALVAAERGLGTCMQEAWATRAKTVAALLGLPATHQLYCGMAIGYADETAPVNALRSARAGLDEIAWFHE